MGFTLTENARLASEKLNLEPQIVLSIEGVSTLYGARIIEKKVKIGDDGLIIGSGWKIGGRTPVPDQSDLISLAGTTNSIRQQLQPDKGVGSSISSMQIVLVDRDLEATELVTPGLVVDDVLGRRAKVYLGFKDVAFPDDYIPIFRGIITDIDAPPGQVILSLSHPDQKKRQTLFTKKTTRLIGGFTLSCTITSGSNAVTTASTLELVDGMSVTGPGIPAGTEISSITSGSTTAFSLSKNATSSGTVTLTFGGMNSTITATVVESITDFYFTPNPSNLGLRTYIKVDDEIIEYSGKFIDQPNILIGMSRGQLGTKAAPHSDSTDVETFYRLEGNIIDLALRLMLSDENFSAYAEDIGIQSFNFINVEESVNRGVFFLNVDLVEQIGVTVGDSMFITGATNGANNVSFANEAVITEIITRHDGTVIVLGNKTFIDETDSPAVARFQSQYNVLGAGLGMKPDEVDVDEHLRLKRLFLSNFDVDIYLKDGENIKELIERELYAPAGAYSLPRKSKASVGLHIGPIPGLGTKILSRENITNPAQLRPKRSLSSNFYNTIIYKFDEEIESDEFKAGVITRSEDSINRIPVGTKALVVESRGLRKSLNGENLATQASNRRLNRYKYGAEYLENVKVFFKTGLDIEVGDIVLLDGTGLGLINSSDGTREPKPKLYEVINKTLDIKTGEISFSLVDTNFSTATRYGLISPSSKIKSGLSQTQFVLEPSFNTDLYGTQEGKKWSRFMLPGAVVAVKIRSSNFTTRFAQTVITSVAGNVVTVRDALGFTPQAGDVMELSDYDFSEVTDTIKELYGHMKNSTFFTGTQSYQVELAAHGGEDPAFADGKKPYLQI